MIDVYMLQSSNNPPSTSALTDKVIRTGMGCDGVIRNTQEYSAVELLMSQFA